MSETQRVGVFVCECGPNIKDAMDHDDVIDFAQALENVTLAKSVGLSCSEEGQKLVEADIREHELTRVVFAACSPKEHEKTL